MHWVKILGTVNQTGFSASATRSHSTRWRAAAAGGGGGGVAGAAAGVDHKLFLS